jgi:hypothetical protein
VKRAHDASKRTNGMRAHRNDALSWHDALRARQIFTLPPAGEARSDPAGPELLRPKKSSRRLTSAASYGFGDVRAATVALLTVTLLSGSRTCGVATTTFAGHVATSRSSLTVFADTAIPGSTCTRILFGKPPSAI